MLKITIYSWIAAWKDGKGKADNKENQIEPQPNIDQQIHTISTKDNEITKPKQQTKDQINNRKIKMKTTTVNKIQITQKTQT